MREGGVAPAFLLSDYSLNRRRATLIAAVIDLDARLADGAIQMFDRLVGSLFTRSEEHTSELQSLMRISYAVFCLKKKIKQKHNFKEHKCNRHIQQEKNTSSTQRIL